MTREHVSHAFGVVALAACAMLWLASAQAAPSATAPPGDLATDSDGDGTPDAVDNCRDVANAGAASCDSDRDGYGNACDGDFNNDGASDGGDFGSTHFLADFVAGVESNNTAGDPQGTDMNCDGSVDGADFSTPNFITQFVAGSPGASGLDCAGTVPCSDEVLVIVGFAIPFSLEGELTAEERAAQQGAIQTAQQGLLARLPAGSFSDPSPYRHIAFMSLVVDKEGLAQLLADPALSSVREGQLSKPTLNTSIPLIRADVANGLGCSGAGQSVVVLDTGADTGHSFFAGTNIPAEACFSTTYAPHGATTLCPNGLDSEIGPGAGINCPTGIFPCEHGTHVSGIAVGDDGTLFGVARDADLIPIQVFSEFNSSLCTSFGLPIPCALTYEPDQVLALEHVVDLLDPISPNFINQPIAAVNMSLGGGFFSAPCDSAAPALATAIANLRSLGVATVASSGNDFSKNSLGSPACITDAISVGATDDFDNVANFSNSAYFLDLLAPGVTINSSVPGGGFQNMSGTSMAAPHVAGAWACHMSAEPTSSVATVLDVLSGTGVPVTDSVNGIVTPRIDVRGACCTPFSTANMVGWWPGDNNADDISGNANDGTFIGGPTYVAGMVDDAFSFSPSGSDFVQVPDDPTLNFGLGSFSIDAWVNLQGSGAFTAPPRTIVKKMDGAGGGYHLHLAGDHICYGLRSNTASDVSICTIYTVPTTGWHLIVWSVDRGANETRLYIDGLFIDSFNITGFAGALTPTSDLEIGTSFDGLIDEVEVFDYAVGNAVASRLHGAGGRGKCKVQ